MGHLVMTDIAQENNFLFRTVIGPRVRNRGIAAEKIAARYRLAQKILAGYCAARGITAEQLRAKDQRFQAVVRRRRYALLCKKEGIGRCIIASMLHMNGSTVAAYLDPRIIDRKVTETRARRLALKSACTNIVSVPR